MIETVATGDGRALKELFDRHAPWVAARLRRTMPRIPFRRRSSQRGARRLVALAMLAVGLSMVCLYGARDPVGEIE